MNRNRIITVLIILVVYVVYMVLSALLVISGKKQNDTLKSKLQKQDLVGGVVSSVEFPETVGLRTRAMVEHDGGRYRASVPPETKVGDEVRILLHEGYAVHSSFRDDPFPHLYFAGHRNVRSDKESSGVVLLLFGATFAVGCLGCGAMYLYSEYSDSQIGGVRPTSSPTKYAVQQQ